MIYSRARKRVAAEGAVTMAATTKGQKKEELIASEGEGDPRRALKGTNIELPAYVWDQAREYLNRRPDMRFRNVVMEGLRAIGFEIDDSDLIAQRKRGPAG